MLSPNFSDNNGDRRSRYHGTRHHDSGIVEQVVQTPRLSDCDLHHLAEPIGVPHVQLRGNGRSAPLTDAGGDLLRGLHLSVRKHDMDSSSRELFPEGAADA